MFHKPIATSVGDCVLGTRPKFKKRNAASEEMFRIDGTVQGSMNYPKHHVTIGETGVVKANVLARIIIVEGTVEGDIEAEEAVYLRPTAHVLGNIRSPRVAIAEGATLDGGLKTS